MNIWFKQCKLHPRLFYKLFQKKTTFICYCSEEDGLGISFHRGDFSFQGMFGIQSETGVYHLIGAQDEQPFSLIMASLILYLLYLSICFVGTNSIPFRNSSIPETPFILYTSLQSRGSSL
jgi:hypothetical protein